MTVTRDELKSWWAQLCNMTSDEFSKGADKPIRRGIERLLNIDECGQALS